MKVTNCYSRVLNAIKEGKDIIVLREKDYEKVLTYVMNKGMNYVECSAIYSKKLIDSGITGDVKVLRKC